MGFPEELKRVRKNCYMSQQEFANEVGVSFSTVNRWEKGKSLPNYQTMKRLMAYCKMLQIDVEELEKSWKEDKDASDSY